MPIRVQCASCGRRLSAPDAMAGKKARCPKCKNVMPVPTPGPAASQGDDMDLKPLDDAPQRNDLDDDVWDWSGEEPGTYGLSGGDS